MCDDEAAGAACWLDCECEWLECCEDLCDSLVDAAAPLPLDADM